MNKQKKVEYICNKVSVLKNRGLLNDAAIKKLHRKFNYWCDNMVDVLQDNIDIVFCLIKVKTKNKVKTVHLLSYMLIYNYTESKHRFINAIDSFKSGHNYASRLIDHSNHQHRLIPKIIAEDSKDYWRNYLYSFEDIEEKNNDGIIAFLESKKLTYSVEWLPILYN